jgi:hypothetical protein
MSDCLSSYLSLIPYFHAQRPKYMNTLAAIIQPFCDAQAMLSLLTADFDLDGAAGVQLDACGQWIGRTRYVEEPVTGVFFSFDDGGGARTGFDYGIWLGPYQPTDAITALDDDTYRTVLQLQAIANEWNGTLIEIQQAFNNVFPGVVIQDKGDSQSTVMTMDVLIPTGEMNSVLLAVLEQDFPIKPAGVQVNIIESTVSTVPIFGFDIGGGTAPIQGFDTGAWGQIILTT